MTMRFVRNLVSGGFIEVFQLQNRCLDTVLCRLAVYSLLKYPRSCRNCSVQKLGCLRHLLVHPSATKIVFHLPRLKLPRLKFLLAARGSCLYCCPHPWFSVIYHFPLLLLRVVLKLQFLWKTWSHTTSADMICSIKASDVVQFLLFSPVGSSKLLFGSWISMYRWVASGYCLQ